MTGVVLGGLGAFDFAFEGFVWRGERCYAWLVVLLVF